MMVIPGFVEAASGDDDVAAVLHYAADDVRAVAMNAPKWADVLNRTADLMSDIARSIIRERETVDLASPDRPAPPSPPIRWGAIEASPQP